MCGLNAGPWPGRAPMGDAVLSLSQWVVRVCLYLVAGIAMLGGSLRMALGQPG